MKWRKRKAERGGAKMERFQCPSCGLISTEHLDINVGNVLVRRSCGTISIVELCLRPATEYENIILGKVPEISSVQKCARDKQLGLQFYA